MLYILAVFLYLQISELGIEYEGPINYNSTDSVQLDDIDPIISTEERDLLTRVLADMERDALDEEIWLCEYAVARSFIHSITQNAHAGNPHV